MARQIPKAPRQSPDELIAKLNNDLPDIQKLAEFRAQVYMIKFRAYHSAGFTQEEAFALLLNEK